MIYTKAELEAATNNFIQGYSQGSRLCNKGLD